MQLNEDILSSGKERVALIGNVPESGRWHAFSPLFVFYYNMLMAPIVLTKLLVKLFSY